MTILIQFRNFQLIHSSKSCRQTLETATDPITISHTPYHIIKTLKRTHINPTIHPHRSYHKLTYTQPYTCKYHCLSPQRHFHTYFSDSSMRSSNIFSTVTWAKWSECFTRFLKDRNSGILWNDPNLYAAMMCSVVCKKKKAINLHYFKFPWTRCHSPAKIEILKYYFKRHIINDMTCTLSDTPVRPTRPRALFGQWP